MKSNNFSYLSRSDPAARVIPGSDGGVEDEPPMEVRDLLVRLARLERRRRDLAALGRRFRGAIERRAPASSVRLAKR
jgi:hypothetical protein